MIPTLFYRPCFLWLQKDLSTPPIQCPCSFFLKTTLLLFYLHTIQNCWVRIFLIFRIILYNTEIKCRNLENFVTEFVKQNLVYARFKGKVKFSKKLKSTNHTPLTWCREGQKVTLVAVIGEFRSDLSITRKTDKILGILPHVFCFPKSRINETVVKVLKDKQYFTYWHSCGVASKKLLDSIFNCFLFVHSLVH